MRLIILFFSFFLFLFSGLKAQTTITGVVSDSLNNPVTSASVYMSKTTIGTLTDNKGVYVLNIPQGGVYELTTSYMGYKPVTQLINADSRKQTINIRLSINLILLNEVTVRSKSKNRLKNYTQFAKLFLGETTNSQSCKIINPADLHLYKDNENNILTAFSTKPLRIENRALGYTILYDLSDFSYNPETDILRFGGNFYFQPLKGNSRNNKLWIRNRLSAYYGSRMHFFRTIFSDSVYKENFRLFDCKTDSVTKELLVNNPIHQNNIILSENSSYKALYYNNPILIKYTDNHSELATGLTGFQPQQYISTILFSDKIKVYQNGFFNSPYSITWGGKMADERVADLLPFDFLPYAKEKNEPDSDLVKSPVEKYLLTRQKSHSPDEVFVQLDRNMYKPGDTVYFRAYIRDRLTNTFESKSVSLYALLFDDKQLRTDSARFKIDNSASSGWMTLPATAGTGKYHFVAFTGSMQNSDPIDAFQLDLYIRALNNNLILKNTHDTTAIKEVNIPAEDDNSELRFLPEGGALVSGLEQRIGFNATNLKGEPVYIEGLLKNSAGSILDTIKSGNYGPGQFFCTPQPGMFVELIKGAGKQKIWPLPDQIDTGICLSVKPVNNRSFAVEIQSDSYKGETVIVSGVINTTQIFYEELLLNKKQRIVVETDQLPSGVAQITLFTKELSPIADRLFYINADKHLKFNIKTAEGAYSPGQESELEISVTDGQGNPAEGIFSIAVTDSVSGHDAEIFAPGIEYTFNYHPNFFGNLPAKVLVKGLENLSNEERDLLLMVYGWSKYNWDFSHEVKSEKELVNYELLNMKILYALKSRRADRRLDLVSLEGPSIKHLLTDNKGEISLSLDSLPEVTRSVTMMPNTGNKKRVMGAMLSIPYNEKYFKSNKLYTPQVNIPVDVYKTAPAKLNSYLGDDVIEIPGVTITGHLENKKVYHDKYEEMYQYARIKSLDYELLWTSSSLEDAVRRLISPYRITNDYIILNGPRSFFGGSVPALIVQDGTPLYSNGWQWAKMIQPGEITSLTILKGNQGSTLYGLAAAGGVIFINSRSSDPNLMRIRTDWKLQHKKDRMLLPINIYRSDIEFYSPTKIESDNDPILQSRSTIFWDPEVYFDGKEPVRIKYTNLKRRGPVIITVNGVSVSNLVGAGRASYQVF